MSLSLPQWPSTVTLDEALQMVITARQQYHTIHTQVQQLREAWASSTPPSSRMKLGISRLSIRWKRRYERWPLYSISQPTEKRLRLALKSGGCVPLACG
jgi:hypothetical protein